MIHMELGPRVGGISQMFVGPWAIDGHGDPSQPFLHFNDSLSRT